MREGHIAQFIYKSRQHKRRVMARYDQMILARLNRNALGGPYDWRAEQRDIHNFNKRNADGHYN